MITFDIIRGHKLLLWAKRLEFQTEFIEQLDKFGTHYVQQIEQNEDGYTVVVLAKLIDNDVPFPIVFSCDAEQLSSLVEKVQVES